jgi:hypothetical protein
VGSRSRLVPGPGIFERLNLGSGFRASPLVEEDVVVNLTIERRIEVDEIDALVRYIAL